MIEFGKIIYAKHHVEDKPQNDYRRKAVGKLAYAQWLERKEKDQDTARCANDGASVDVWISYLEALDGTQNRLCWCEDTVCHN
jgi:hypothetical protein